MKELGRILAEGRVVAKIVTEEVWTIQNFKVDLEKCNCD